ncbi:exodeoxyribonuclease V alpha subunit [Bradyrhizobium ottawaense]
MIHLSVRLPWHDRGWDGHICDQPELNGYCCGLRSVNAERIRTRDLDEEANQRGQSVSGKSYRPPCTETLNVFGMEAVSHLHTPPSFIDGAQPTQEVYEPGSSGTWPFENMWLQSGEFRPAVERKQEADRHFKAVEPNRSFVFYYCNYDNPLSGDANRYLLVGAARVKSVAGASSSWPGASREAADRYGGFVWSRRISNGGPSDRVRLPYQELLKGGIGADELSRFAVFVPGDLSDRFKYVSRHLDDDDAAILFEQMLGFYRRAISEGHLSSESLACQHALDWLDGALADCWLERGPFPGLAAVLHFLDFKEPAEFVKNELVDILPEQRRDWVFACIEEEEDPPPMQRHRFAPSIDRWKSLDSPLQKLLKERMVLFALDERQIEMALGPKHKSWGIEASAGAIYENPYILSEDFLGEETKDRISFGRIDHGMRPRPPHDLHARVEAVSRIDGRRLRAILVNFLRDAAEAGHTFLDQSELAETISDPDGDPSAVRGALVDEARWRQHRELFGEKLLLSQVNGVNAVFLRAVNEDEGRIRTDVVRLLKDGLIEQSGVDWRDVLAGLNRGMVAVDAVPQQAAALEILYRSRFSILTGGAGTGKTTVLRAFVTGLRQLEPNHPVLLLAPTGKASVLLETRVGLQSETVHRFLARLNWMRLSNFSLLRGGGERESSARTIIIDESSMLDVTLLAATLRAINFDYVDRLVLVGDPGQLPPIGPGKPFLDLVEYLKKDKRREANHLGELAFNCRQAEGSKIALLADHFARVEERPPEDVLELLQKGGDFGDLSVRTYANEEALPALIAETYLDELHRLSGETIRAEGSFEPVRNPSDDYRKAFRLNELNRVDLDRLQVLAPYRLVIDEINETVRRKVLGLAPIGMFNGLAPL